MKKYYLHARSGVYYAEIFTDSGVKLSARSTGKRNRDDALIIVGDWLKNGLPTGKQRKPKPVEMATDLPTILKAIKKADLNPEEAMTIVSALRERELVDFGVAKSGPGKEKFIPFLLKFWNLTESPYLRDQLAHGHKITVNYCKAMSNNIGKHWRKYFGDSKQINDISRSELRDFSLSLHAKGLASSTINNVMAAGTSALKWAHSEGLIPSNPTLGLVTFTGNKVSRDILTVEETDALFQTTWKDKRAYSAALLSLTTGIRSGEIRAIRRSSIGETTIDISNSWNDGEGLKCPKNGNPRIVPLLPEVRLMLTELLQENPHKGIDDPFVFYSDNPNKPCSAELFRRNFRRACQSLSRNPPGWFYHKEDANGDEPLWVSKKEKNKPWGEPQPVNVVKKEEGYEYIYCKSFMKPQKPIYIDLENKNLDIHSLRHAFATRLAERMESDKVAKVTGHKSKAAAKIYQGHITARILNEMGNETAQEFAKILQFQKKKGA